MLNFNGIPYSFVPGRNVPNKEPPTNRFVVEKLYRVHRQRMQKMEPIVDCYVEIPDFLTNNDWKLQGQMHKRQEIARENEVIYKRIAKAERTESLITKETREHAKHAALPRGAIQPDGHTVQLFLAFSSVNQFSGHVLHVCCSSWSV